MTEYDYDWPNINEVGEIPFASTREALDIPGREFHPDTGELPEAGPMETIPPNVTSRTFRELLEARSAEEEEEEEEDDDDEEEDEDEEGEEGEGEEEEEEEEESGPFEDD